MSLFGRRSARGNGDEDVAEPFQERRSGVDRRRVNLLALEREGSGEGSQESGPVSPVAAIEAAEAGRFRGAILEPAEGTILSGIVELVAQPGETAGALRELRLEWSAEGKSWHPAVAPPEAYEVLASTAEDAELRQVALMQSAELAERLRLALAGSDLYRRVEVRPAESAPELAAWRADRLTPRWDARSVADGDYLLRVVTMDEMGLSVESEPLRLRVDNLGPEVMLREDLSSRTLEGVEEIELEAHDPVSGVALVALELSPDGRHWQRIAETRRQPFLLRWVTGDLPDGRYLLRPRARDGIGNEHTGETLAVHVRNAPAAPRLEAPASFLRGPLELVAHAGDQRTVQMVFELAPAGAGEWRQLGTTRAPFRLSVDTSQLPDGLFDFRVEALAAGGQSARSARVERRRIDNTPPTIVVVEPRTRAVGSGPCEIVIEATDHGSGIERVELAVRQEEGWRQPTLAPADSDCWRCELELEPGEAELRIGAVDRAGNETQHSLALEVTAPQPASEEAPDPFGEPGASEHELAEARFGELPRWQDGQAPPRPAEAWGWRRPQGEPEPEPVEEPRTGAPGIPPSLREPAPPAPELEPRAEAEEPAAGSREESNLVEFPRFAGGWDIFELAQLTAESAEQDPIRRVEREQILYFLREHTSLDGRIPPEFDGLIRETFGELVDR
jgi:hypothetical protein